MVCKIFFVFKILFKVGSGDIREAETIRIDSVICHSLDKSCDSSVEGIKDACTNRGGVNYYGFCPSAEIKLRKNISYHLCLGKSRKIEVYFIVCGIAACLKRSGNACKIEVCRIYNKTEESSEVYRLVNASEL